MAGVTILEGGIREVEHAAADGIGDLLDWVVAEARRTAPVGTAAEHDEHPGEFRDSIHAERDAHGGSVVSDSDHSAYVEFGTNDTPAHPTITPAFNAAMAHLQEIVGGRMAEELG